ncbi:peptide chain release factor N(5)-glutamine methyltransferase [Oscillatoria sp. FACHB-1407]|uniref:peptide chain release factor N(5)-glutamine methyltransferase n=1 Tax=Oscillatoria sp. FACHB-1407 TaxID=2692847 RepID=UPI001F54D7D8|nr:peptide chain release factor N(5)-glutamine methyltransferase [Oscillatoria sp. FACHB-1407]
MSSPHSISGLDLWQWRIEARQQAIAATVPITELDWLLEEIADLDRLSLRLETFKERSHIPLKIPFADLQQRWQQRLQERVPIQYLAGETPWRHLTLRVAPGVLIPRPETEGIVDLVLAAMRDRDPSLAQGHWADLGTGSGAIAIGLADALPNATIHAVDFSEDALAIAQHNAQTLGFSHRIRFYQGSWFDPLSYLKGQLSGMVSNPPYIPSHLIPTLQPEVQHEPHLALDGGTDGLDAIRHLVAIAPHSLKPGAIWVIEMMAGQADAVTQLLQQNGHYDSIQVHPDLAGIERFALAYLKK